MIGGCKVPSINLATSEPIKVDIAMRLDVYQHDADGSLPAATPKPGAASAAIEPGRRRKDREADIQTFKNSGYVGEAHDGLLVILKAPDGDPGDYVRHAVSAENSDRMADMKTYARSQKLSLAEVQTGQGELWQKRAFKGEWIEVKDANGGYRWVQKAG
jgi:uncharacterized protein YdbL (DUF1318 family)